MDPALMLGSVVAITLLALLAKWLYPTPQVITQTQIDAALTLAFPMLSDTLISADRLTMTNGSQLIKLPDAVYVGYKMGDQVIVRKIGESVTLSTDENAVKIIAKDSTAATITLRPAQDTDFSRIAVFTQSALG